MKSFSASDCIKSKDIFTWLGLLGLFLVLPSLWSGFFTDDFSHNVLVNHPDLIPQPDNLSLWHLFTFMTDDDFRRSQLQAVSALPWWINPEFSLVFWRPLAEISHYLDYKIIQVPWLMHLHSLVWYALLLFLLARFYQSFCGPRKVAVLAFLLFVVDATHAFTVAWLANRNALMAAVFTLAAILSHHHYRQAVFDKSRLYWSMLSVICIALSFLSAEAGISVGIFLLAYALFVDNKGWQKGLLALTPALLVFIVWAVIYKTYGYGASGNKAYYVDLLSSPIFYFENFILRFPMALAMQFNPLPIHLVSVHP